MATWSGCRRPIVFEKTIHGRPMPLDPEPNPDGNVVMRTILAGASEKLAVVLGEGEEPLEGESRRMPHWNTCPKAERFRRGRKR